MRTKNEKQKNEHEKDNKGEKITRKKTKFDE